MKNKNWFWGSILLLSGVLVVASMFGSFGQIGFWTIIATILLGATFLNSVVRLSFVGMLLSAALLYIIYQPPMGWMYLSPWLLILAALLVGGGLSTLFRRKPRWAQVRHHGQPYPTNGGYRPKTIAEENNDDNHPYAKVSFGASSKYLHAAKLETGQFYASFGTLEVFFDQATLSENGAEIYVDSSFSSVKLFVPKGWRVIDKVTGSVGGVSIDDRFSQPDPAVPALTLTGNVSFGDVEVIFV